jgi:lysophospholipase L1-like esterase
MDRRQFCGLTLAGLGLVGYDRLFSASALAADAPTAFFFRDGDRVVMIGDSITEQHLHSNFVEAYTVSRFPAWKFRFRNAGIGGDTSAGGNRRTERDILSFNPTAVTITFGMNDGGYKQPYDQPRLDAYRTGLQGMLDQMKGKDIRVAVLSSSPVEKKEDGAALEGYNQTLEAFAANAKEIAQSRGATFVDQFHPHLAALQKARDASATNRINGGDAVHPGPSGQIMMAWAILKGLGAPALVSAVEINGKKATGHNCTVSSLQRDKMGLKFSRMDNAVPFYIPKEARSILQWVPVVEDLDQYTLKVAGLPAGSYSISIDGEKVTSTTADELGKGLNLALVTDGPIAKQAEAVNAAVFAKNRYFHDQIYRGVTLNNQVPNDQKQAMIDQRMPGMEPLEKAIRDALEMRAHVWEVVKA